MRLDEQGPRGWAVRGFSLVSALFLLVVLSMLGTVMVSLSGVQHHSAMLGAQAARAMAAAQTGAEWGAYQAVNGGSCDGSFTLTEAGLAGFTVTVSCSQTTHRERATNYSVYVIDAQATFATPADPAYVMRQMRVKVTDAPDS